MSSANVARRVVEKFDLVPPVDIHALLADSAIVTELAWPQECDGIVVGLTTPGRPHVFIRSDQAPNRDRFTRAHEWGHIMIPWHLGDVTLECDTSKFDPIGSVSEREANDFASRVLVPDRYLADVLARSHEVVDWLDAVGRCEISAHASLLALKRNLPAGFAFVLDAADGDPLVPIASSGTHTPLMRGTPSTLVGEYEAGSLASGNVVLRGRRVWWFRYVDPTPPHLPSHSTANDALESYLQRTGEKFPDGRSKRQSINGVVGGKLRNTAQVDIGWMHGSLRYHISLDPAWSHALSDADFGDFLALRVRELSKRRSGGKL